MGKISSSLHIPNLWLLQWRRRFQPIPHAYPKSLRSTRSQPLASHPADSHNQRPRLSSHMLATTSRACYGHRSPAGAWDHHRGDAAPAVALHSSSAQHPKGGDLPAHRLGPRPQREKRFSSHCCKRLVDTEISAQGFWRDRRDVLLLQCGPKARIRTQCQVAPRSRTAFLHTLLPEAALPHRWATKLAHSKISASIKGDEKQQQSHPCATSGQVGPCEGSPFTTEKSDH